MRMIVTDFVIYFHPQIKSNGRIYRWSICDRGDTCLYWFVIDSLILAWSDYGRLLMIGGLNYRSSIGSWLFVQVSRLRNVRSGENIYVDSKEQPFYTCSCVDAILINVFLQFRVFNNIFFQIFNLRWSKFIYIFMT